MCTGEHSIVKLIEVAREMLAKEGMLGGDVWRFVRVGVTLKSIELTIEGPVS
jgi:hypothetical protein